MFYKIKGISPKTGKGTVSVVYRQTGANPFEVVKSTGVTVKPADVDLKSGRVKSRVEGYPELNAKIQDITANLEVAVRDCVEAAIPLSLASVNTAYANALAIEAA